MMDYLEPSKLLEQAKMTARDYLADAVRAVDDVLGEGAARKHPAVVAAVIQAASADYGASLLAQTLSQELFEIGERLRGIEAFLDKDD